MKTILTLEQQFKYQAMMRMLEGCSREQLLKMFGDMLPHYIWMDGMIQKHHQTIVNDMMNDNGGGFNETL